MSNYLCNLFYQLRKFWQSIVVWRIRSSYPLNTARVIVKTDSRDRYLRIICVFTTPGKFIARATTCFVNEIKISIHAPLEDKIDVNMKVGGLSVPHTVQINDSKIFISLKHLMGCLFSFQHSSDLKEKAFTVLYILSLLVVEMIVWESLHAKLSQAELHIFYSVASSAFFCRYFQENSGKSIIFFVNNL